MLETPHSNKEYTRDLVAGAGFEPTTFGLWARRAARLLHPAISSAVHNIEKKSEWQPSISADYAVIEQNCIITPFYSFRELFFATEIVNIKALV